jgi:hypothetical protein
MAPFAPEGSLNITPETEIPDYSRYFRPIQEPQPSQGGKILGEAVANTIEEGAKVGDTTLKAAADNELHSRLDPLMDQRNKDLSTMYNAITKGTVVDEQGNPINVHDLLTKPESDRTPSDLKNIGTIAQNLRAGRDHGSYSDTYYRMQIDSIAKDVRSKFPGYRDYIDNKIKDAEGSTANELARSQISDINAALASKQDDTKKVDSLLLSHLGYDGVYEAYVARKNGLIDDNTAVKAVATGALRHQKLEDDAATYRLQDEQKKQQEATVLESTTRRFNEIQENNWRRVEIASGEMATAEKAQSVLQDFRTGKRELSQQELDQAGQVFSVVRDKTRAELTAFLNDRLPDGRTRGEVIGGDKASKLVNDTMSFQDAMHKSFYDGDGAAVQSMKVANQALLEDAEHVMYKGSAGEFVAKLGAVQKVVGPQAVKDALSALIGNDAVKSGWKTWAIDKGYDQVINPTDHRVTLADTLEEARHKAVPPEAVRYVLNEVKERMLDPKTTDAAKFNVAATAFGPGNERAFKDIAAKDRVSIFGDLTSDGVSREIYRLGKVDRATWTNYKNTVESWAGMVTASPIKELNEVQGKDKNFFFTIGWDNDNHSFVVKPKTTQEIQEQTKGMSAPELAEHDRALRTVDIQRANVATRQLNTITSTLSNIAKHEGQDGSVYVIRLLKNLGYDINSAGGIGPELMHAVRTSEQFGSRFDAANPRPKKPE